MGVVLTKLRKKIEVKLPKSEGTLQLWEYPLAGEMLGGMTISPTGMSGSEMSPLEIITSLIAEWDFTDEAGDPLPVSLENVKLLPIPDIAELATHVQKITQASGLAPDVKKNTSSNSTQP